MDGRQGGGAESLQEHRAPFTEPGPAKSLWVGTEGQDRPRHNHCSVLAAPSTHTHTPAHAQTRSLMQIQNIPPAATHTHANTHLYYSGHSPIFLLLGRKTHTYGILLAPSLIPLTLWSILLPPF